MTARKKALPRKPLKRRKIKVDKLDKVFGDCVKLRAGYCCENCNTFYAEGNRAGLECSHFFTRSRIPTRWHPSNAAAHCTSCHFRLGGNPIEFAEWIRNHLGRNEAKILASKSIEMLHIRQAEREEIYQNLKASFEEMSARRESGEAGRLEFEDPYPDYLWA